MSAALAASIALTVGFFAGMFVMAVLAAGHDPRPLSEAELRAFGEAHVEPPKPPPPGPPKPPKPPHHRPVA